MSGRLELIIGGMFSGKSSELIRRLKRYKAIDANVLVINSIKDTRSNVEVLQTHDMVTFDCIKSENLLMIVEDENYKNAHIIGIDEAQFFPNLLAFVKLALADSKHIIVAGLDGDFKQNMFGDILHLIPLCDEVQKLTALCMECRDGTPGPFTKRVCTECSDQELVGANEYYKAVCRYHLTDIIDVLINNIINEALIG
jgi:thymidine kinase